MVIVAAPSSTGTIPSPVISIALADVDADNYKTQEPQNRSSVGSRRRNPTPLTDTQDTIRTLRTQGMSVES